MDKYNYTGNNDLQSGNDVSYGSFSVTKYPDEVFYHCIDECTGSDYSGNTHTKANYDYMKENHSDTDGVYFAHGGWGTYAVFIRGDLLDSSKSTFNQEIQDIVSGLATYPIIDEDLMSHLEMKLETEAWNDYGCNDFRRALKRQFTKDDPVSEDDLFWFDVGAEWQKLAGEDCDLLWEDYFTDLDDDSIYQLWRYASEKANIYPEFETGCLCYFNVDRVAKWCYDNNVNNAND